MIMWLTHFTLTKELDAVILAGLKVFTCKSQYVKQTTRALEYITCRNSSYMYKRAKTTWALNYLFPQLEFMFEAFLDWKMCYKTPSFWAEYKRQDICKMRYFWMGCRSIDADYRSSLNCDYFQFFFLIIVNIMHVPIWTLLCFSQSVL